MSSLYPPHQPYNAPSHKPTYSYKRSAIPSSPYIFAAVQKKQHVPMVSFGWPWPARAAHCPSTAQKLGAHAFGWLRPYPKVSSSSSWYRDLGIGVAKSFSSGFFGAWITCWSHLVVRGIKHTCLIGTHEMGITIPVFWGNMIQQTMSGKPISTN